MTINDAVERAAKAMFFSQHSIMHDHEKLWKDASQALWRDFARDTLAAAYPELVAEIERLKEALSLAVQMLFPYEPGDSRAVSDEFVALAAVDCGLADDKCMKVIRDSLAARATLDAPNAEG